MMSNSRWTAWLLVLFTSAPIRTGHAQTAAAGYEPRTGFYAFCLLQDAKSAQVDQQRGQDPERAAALTRRNQNLLKLGAADFSLVSTISRRVVADVRALSTEGAGYMESVRGRGGKPDPATLANLEGRRKKVLDLAMEELKASLSAAGWVALTRYIDEEVRPRIRGRVLKNGN